MVTTGQFGSVRWRGVGLFVGAVRISKTRGVGRAEAAATSSSPPAAVSGSHCYGNDDSRGECQEQYSTLAARCSLHPVQSLHLLLHSEDPGNHLEDIRIAN